MEGFVHSMETFGLVDGPGVRFVVFLQGCRMRCRYCHNPETWKLEGGTPWTADKLFSHVYRYKSYWNKKGQPNGGITVSGGEPLLQIDFVTEFFKKAKEKGVHTALDTAGNPFTLEEPFISKFEELMKVHDQRIKYLDILNSYVKTPVTKGSIIGMKAHDYFTMGCPDLNTAYNLFKEAVELEKDNADYFVLQEFTDVSGRKVKADETHKEQFIQDYIAAAGYADAAFKKETKAKTKELLKVAKDNIDAFFINSGVATCDNLQSIYAPKVEQNKTNLDYLKQVISVMQMLGCTEQEAYFAASEHAHAIEPTSETAIGCGYMYFKKGDLDKCITYFDQAIELEQDPVKKADYCYKTAAILFNKKQLSKAKQYALKSISLDGSNGKPYILIANMYASSPNWSDENALNKCTYFAVIDKLQRAKSVDSSVEEEANKLIGTYSRYTPKDEDLFFLGLKKGDSVTIGGWIGETTTIR